MFISELLQWGKNLQPGGAAHSAVRGLPVGFCGVTATITIAVFQVIRNAIAVAVERNAVDIDRHKMEPDIDDRIGFGELTLTLHKIGRFLPFSPVILRVGTKLYREKWTEVDDR